ncbi:hypothetical protein LNKW23_11690 [Paralimibaculum aggregatum]|uniref:Methyltransferase type 11 domain-containing protein n=1 Tax=Paralimibaculum aggregatum TaxID=3036245 RepID=A0ABQ6LHP6_9RHOB|nr:class I SAM-dependent methyltransferase [Limibaculum sp. NKW23]GMG81956.1 hypothetical protein LNKW23_11690 [Limibaculum sp. NKW23]
MSPPEPSGRAAGDAAVWERVGADWIAAPRQGLWRAHADAVSAGLIARWLPTGLGAVLKTDLFDEAVAAGTAGHLAAHAAELHGIDIAPSVVAAARARYPRLRGEIADLRALPHADGRFDAVVSLSSLDHFETAAEIARALAEIRRVLRTGGLLLLTLDNPSNPVLALRQALPQAWLLRSGLVPYPCGATLRPSALRRAVAAAGFAIREETAVLHCPRAIAIRLAARAERRGEAAAARLRARLAAWERLERWPTRRITGYFNALLAEARP